MTRVPGGVWAGGLVLVLTSGAVGPGAALRDGPPAVERTVLWRAGEGGYHTYRIPALLVTPRGSALAFCEGRKTGPEDHGDIDLLARRSTDGGRTWSAAQVVHEEGGAAPITIGNPCPVVDARTGTIWLPFTRDNRRVLITSSADDGQTWAPPRDLSATVTRPDWVWVATGPGIGIQLATGPHSGRLVVPCDHKRTGTDGQVEEWNSHMMFSDDGGQTWSLSAPIQKGGNECQVVERADGSLLVNTRMQGAFEGWRGTATSADGGATWTAIAQERQLPCPKCQASLLRVGPRELLFSNPDPGPPRDGQPRTGRVNLTVRMSADDGQTWPIARRLHEGPSAYSSLAVLPDGTFLCLYEGGARAFRETLTLARFPRGWLTATPDRP